MCREFECLKNGVVLAELGGHGDGPYCAKHGAGAALVMMGTYVVDPGDHVPYPKDFVFKPGRAGCEKYLKEHVAAARAGGARVGVSVISIVLKDAVDFLVAAEAAGADYASLCVHSVMDMFISAGLGMALCRRENLPRLREWAGAIRGAVRIPVIFKMGVEDGGDAVAAVDAMAESGVAVVHIALDGTEAGSEGLVLLKRLSGRCEFLIAGGGIGDVAGARRTLDAGADAVAIATAAMKDPGLCGRIQNALSKG